MNTSITHFTLSKITELTKERDVVALELLLTQSILDILAKMYVNRPNSVVIYNAVDLRKQQFSTLSAGKNVDKNEPSLSLKKILTQCFRSGEPCAYIDNNVAENNALEYSLFPLKNSLGHTTAIVAIEGFTCHPEAHQTITLLLQVYQNFTGLINDNERDTLTGLLNRKTFEYKINKILEAMHKVKEGKDNKPNQLHFLAIFDIDHFKRVNDEFGHLIGDEVLLIFSQLMTKSFRSTDPLFRFGGEEFVGVFECSNYADIQNLLNRFREKVGSFDFPQVGKVTVSAGYTEISAEDASSHLIDSADLALYFAKNNGRNRICHHEQLVADGVLQNNKKTGDIELF